MTTLQLEPLSDEWFQQLNASPCTPSGDANNLPKFCLRY